MKRTQSKLRRPIRVLVLGSEPSTFMTDIARQLNAGCEFEIDLLELDNRPSTYSETELNAAFTRRRSRKSLGLHWTDLGAIVPPVLSERSLAPVRAMLRGAYTAQWPMHIRAKESLRYLKDFHWIDELYASYDIVNLHFLDQQALYMGRHAPASGALIVSLWGSDLLAVPPGALFEQQCRVVEQARCVTMQSAEMREIFLAKFGRDYADRVRVAHFNCDSRIVAAIDENVDGQVRESFRARLSAAPDDIVVTLGHCAGTIDRHIDTLDALQSLPDDVRRRLIVVLPLTYLRTDLVYIEAIKERARISSFRTLCLETFLTSAEVAELRCGSDISVRVSDTDALSAALVEALYAGSIGIVGSWLPYGPLRVAGAHLVDVGKIADLAAVMHAIVRDFPMHREKARRNAERLLPFVSPARVAVRWGELFREVHEQTGRG